jgi:hypothetical protein
MVRLDLCRFEASAYEVTMVEELRDFTRIRPPDADADRPHEAAAVKRTVVARTGSLAESKRVVAEVERQIAAGACWVVRVRDPEAALGDDDTDLEPPAVLTP